jgi:hypothetical protein
MIWKSKIEESESDPYEDDTDFDEENINDSHEDDERCQENVQIDNQENVRMDNQKGMMRNRYGRVIGIKPNRLKDYI